jgi:hypothetical protein
MDNTLRQFALMHGTIVRARVVPEYTSLAGWYRLHTAGVLVRLHAGASRLAVDPATPMMRVEAALAAAMPGSMAGGLTAAWLWGASSAARGRIELIAPPHRHPGRLEGVVYHRPTRQPHPEVIEVSGVRSCNALTATFDVAAWHPDRLVPIIRELLGLGRYRLGELHEVLASERRSGRPGVSMLQTTLARADVLGLRDGTDGRTPMAPGPARDRSAVLIAAGMGASVAVSGG